MIENRTMDEERALYHLCDETVRHCCFEGPADGESALKECRNISAEDCDFRLRYPLWHTENFQLRDSRMTDKARAAIWYAKDGTLERCELGGIKAVRECGRIRLSACTVRSQEFGWQCRDITAERCRIETEYGFLHSSGVKLSDTAFTGKYSFQYTENVLIERCELNTKDAFWHGKNIVVRDSTLRGEYLGWYSENLTLINCLIIGTQPLCYCKNLLLVNCRTEAADLAFEYSEVGADISGSIVSVKNPLSGHIEADSIGEIILEDAVYPCSAVITERGQKGKKA